MGARPFRVDALLLTVGARPRDVEALRKSLGVDRDEDGFLHEGQGMARLTESQRPEVFLCGSCQSPRSLEDTVVHAEAAAISAVGLLRSGVAATSHSTL